MSHASRRGRLGLFLLAGALAGGGLAQDGEQNPPASADLAWLAGSWRQQDGPTVWEETWLPPRAGTMTAVTRWVHDGRLRMYEISAIEDGADGTYLLLRHFGAGLAIPKSEADAPKRWKLAACEGRRAVFEAPAQGFPQRIVYHRSADDVLEVHLEGTGDDAAKRIDFRFARVAPAE